MTDYPFWSSMTCCCIVAIGTAIFAVLVALRVVVRRGVMLGEFMRGNLRRRWRM